MAGIGICTSDDLALAVVVTVIGHRPAENWIITDGGWMATSRDRGTQNQPVDQGYGLVTDPAGQPIPDLIMTGASQEHGILSTRPGATHPTPDRPWALACAFSPTTPAPPPLPRDRWFEHIRPTRDRRSVGLPQRLVNIERTCRGYPVAAAANWFDGRLPWRCVY